MSDIRAAHAKLLHALRGKRGFLGLGRSVDLAGRTELQILWLEGIPIPGLPASVGGVPIRIQLSGSIAALNANPEIGGWFNDWHRGITEAWRQFSVKKVLAAQQETRPGLAMQEARERAMVADIYRELTSVRQD
jgi:hypothetical protein